MDYGLPQHLIMFVRFLKRALFLSMFVDFYWPPSVRRQKCARRCKCAQKRGFVGMGRAAVVSEVSSHITPGLALQTRAF